ncbi:MAG: UDP-glucose 4-epimerase GalE [Acidobacteriota bacterium]
MRVLVTGGAGYIGSHVIRALLDAGHEVVVLDDLRDGHRSAIGGGAHLVEGDIADPASLDRALGPGGVQGVIHMAASCLVGESMRRPTKYFDNNVVRGLRLIELLIARGVRSFVLSSTAAVYGSPTVAADEPITEDHPCAPTNVYGETKLALERALDWYARCTPLRAVALRYFNAAGADPGGSIGEDHDPETHLIPLICRAARDPAVPLTVMGRDYDTPDGTCLRDYVHVHDLAAAHLLALKALEDEPDPGGLQVYNLGAERALSVMQVLAAAERVIGRKVPFVDGSRRPGDPPVLLASSERIRRDLGWNPRKSDIDTILRTAWHWHDTHPSGYGGDVLS